MNDSVSADNDPLAHVTPYGSFVGIRFERRGGPSLKAIERACAAVGGG
jgi:hypothetical protein